jgi:hypothetical protein
MIDTVFVTVTRSKIFFSASSEGVTRILGELHASIPDTRLRELEGLAARFPEAKFRFLRGKSHTQ